MSSKDEIADSRIEKATSNEIEMSNEGKFADEEYTESEVRKIIHRVDRRLIIVCGLMVAVSLLDRGNLGHANIAGMSADLGLATGTRYSLIVLIFFAPYIAAILPCTVLVRKLGPRWTLPALTAAWGLVSLGFGFVHNWTVLVGLRIILGILESGLFPGTIYLMSVWYTRYDIHKRYSFFYLIGLVGSSLGGVLSYAFMQMAGLGGLGAWRWIFVMEGVLTCVIAAIAFCFLVGSPQDAPKAWRFLTEKEAALIIRRIEKDRNDAAVDQNCSTIMGYAVAYFLPLILNHELGFSIGVSQLLCTPPYMFAGVMMYAEGWLCDKYQVRSAAILYNALQTILGLCLLAWTSIPGVQYFGVFLVTSGCNSNIPAVLAWQANNIRGHWNRTFCSASLVGMGGLGGIIGALVFRSQDAPLYLPGMYASIAANIIVILITSSMVLYFRYANKQAAEGKRVIADLPGFQYTL
ncbi:Uncharacterized protein BP5553_06856 [Venustampulla echinocandica]|uniref:Major facilitator superfamily (MFS) profile domain-containing protein n=1 Tax=Venustampulla echinocandica TaxID=2656787 RepID=A0A370TL47_9HELO|nr:Uncharacterized protein BP5553_06856 [Venustampulla echinocandica]RDL36244.1 Uncharacterized protein BP5553_06856 [Venustampulla echinocandica]